MDPTLALAVGLAAGAGGAYVAVRRLLRENGSRAASAVPVALAPSPARAAAPDPDVSAQLEKAKGDAEAARAAHVEALAALAEARTRLEEAAGLTADEARSRLLGTLDRELEGEKARRVQASLDATRAEADARAREIVCTALQRVAAHHAAERSVSTVVLPDEGFKGRVIGRDGRNAAAFERATGCDLVVDDASNVVTVSGFDPVRREVARRALCELVADGRIHPARIDEVVEATRRTVEEDLVEAGRRALLECGVGTADPTVTSLLGRLQYRTSYGQNVLRHSVEVAHLCGAMAGEMGLDVVLAKRVGLLHDLGKAVDHEVEGGHATIGGDIARRCGESEAVVNGIAAHHEDIPQATPYAVLAQVGDAISASRPGARSDSADRYLQRLKNLEAVAAGFAGVEEAYAVQAGREVRVVVDAAKVSDAAAPLLAREIARAVEAALTYPGEIKVTVLRETSATHYAR